MQRKNYYEVLEVRHDADIAEIEEAYKELIDVYSYDSTGTYSLYEDEQRERLLLEIEEAYKVLSNEAKRKQYDNVYLISDYKESKNEGREVRSDSVKNQRHVRKEKEEPPKMDEAIKILKDLSPENADGGLLRNLRLVAGMSVKDVSLQTKIPIQHIVLIEENSYSKMPGRTYVLGFVKLNFKIYTDEYDKFALAYIKKYDESMAKREDLKKE